MKKYDFTGKTKEFNNTTLHQIVAVRDFRNIKIGDIGGWIECEENLSHEGDAWVYGDAMVYSDAQVYDNAHVYDNARVYDNAMVCGNAWVCGNAQVYSDAQVYDNAWVYGDARVCGYACTCGNACICEETHILTVGPAGSRNDFTTFYRDIDNDIAVSCGCFEGKINLFLKVVQETHGDNHHAKVYRMAAELARVSIDLVKEADRENE